MTVERGAWKALIQLVLVAVLPLLIFGGGVAWMIVDQAESATTSRLSSTTSALRVAVDHELLGQIKQMETLATDVSLDRDDIAMFNLRAKRVVAANGAWFGASLIDPHSYAIFDTTITATTTTTAARASALSSSSVDEVVRTRKPVILGAFATGKIFKKPFILLMAPVIRNDEVRYILSVLLDPNALSNLFAEQRLAPTWTGAIIDSHLVLAGRSRDPERFVGVPATPSLANRITAAQSGLFTAINQEGQTVYTVFNRSALTGWSLVIGVPAQEVEAPIRDILRQLIIAGVVLIAFALALSWLVGREIVESRKITEQERIRLQALLESASDGIHIIDEQGKLKEYSHAFAGMLGYADNEVIDFNIADWEAQIPREKLAEHVRALIQTPVTLLTHYRRKDGTIIDVEVAARAINLDGKDYLYCSGRDVTQRKQMEAALVGARETAEAANVAKSRFLATMSHEIRTPMNGIIGLSKLALNQETSEETREYLQQISRSSESLRGILNDILDFSKLESGKFQIDHVPFYLAQVREILINLYSPSAKEKGIEFRIEVDPDIPKCLMGDPLRLQQILSNLLSNAIKFTEQGEVLLEVKLRASEPSHVLICFCISDTGIGISSDSLHNLSKPFAQADGSISRRFGGTGLGLAISSKLLKLMDSELNVESVIDQGSKFFFELTLGTPPAAESPEHSNRFREVRAAGALGEELAHQGSKLIGARVLLAEDNVVNQLVAKEFLRLSGVIVDIANHGGEAVALANSNHYDAILMDVHMPVMDGFETTRAIRKQPRFATLPIIALSAGVTAEEHTNCLSAGMNDFIAKPIHPEELIKTLLRWITLNHREPDLK